MGFFKSKSMDVDDDPVGYVCRSCNAPTSVATLNSYGALCGPCYAEYCRRPFPPKPGPSNSPTVRDMESRLKGSIGSF